MLSVSRQLELLLSGAADVIPEDELQRKLERSVRTQTPLRVKLGIDPSAPDLHLGHAVVLRTLRRFQELGHTAVLIVGDFTGRVGDPSGQSETRPMLEETRLEENARTYLDQVGKVLDLDRAEIRRNGEWLATLTFGDVATLASTQTVARLLEREDFKARYESERPISLVEFLYPLMQGYDSVAIGADVEMGGTDQRFNLLVGRDVQRAHGQEPQVAFTMPLLVGTDGERKMSKSLGNHIGLTEPPEEQFGKAMSIPDGVMPTWFRLCTDLEPEELAGITEALQAGALSPVDAKRRLAREIVRLYHGEEAANAAEQHFDRVFRAHELPDDVPNISVPKSVFLDTNVLAVPDLLFALGLVSSKSDARRMLRSEAVRARWPDGESDRGERITAEELAIAPDRVAGSVWSVGKRRFARVERLA